MSWGFRKRIKVIPGVFLNLSRRGISATIGVPGVSVNIGKDGVYRNLSIPGTGLYGRDKIINYKPKGSRREFHYIPNSEQLTQDKIAYAKYYIASIENETEGLRKMHANGFFTDEELERKLIEFGCDAEYLEMKSFLESLTPPEPEIIHHNKPLQFTSSNEKEFYWSFWDILFVFAFVAGATAIIINQFK